MPSLVLIVVQQVVEVSGMDFLFTHSFQPKFRIKQNYISVFNCWIFCFISLKLWGVQRETYLLVCNYFELVNMPATTKHLHLFAVFLSRTFTSTDIIKQYVSGVKSML